MSHISNQDRKEQRKASEEDSQRGRAFTPGHAKAKGLSEDLGNSRRQLRRVQETQTELAPMYHYTSCSGSNRNNAKVLLRDTDRLGCLGNPTIQRRVFCRQLRGQTRETGEARA